MFSPGRIETTTVDGAAGGSFHAARFFKGGLLGGIPTVGLLSAIGVSRGEREERSGSGTGTGTGTVGKLFVSNPLILPPFLIKLSKTL